MPGTILKQLSATPQGNGTTVTMVNSGWSSLSIGGGNSYTFQSAAAMGLSVGYRMVQDTNPNFAYMDLVSSVAVFAFRIPFRFSTNPSTNNTLFRLYPDTGHVTNLGGLILTTTRRIQFQEQGAGGLNVSSPSGSPLIAGTNYIIMGLINLSDDTLDVRVYEAGSATPHTQVSGALAADLASAAGIGSVRYGFGTASTGLSSIDTNDGWAIGSGDWLARYDLDEPLATPVINIDSFSHPTTIGGSEGTATISWGAVSGAVSYQAYIATGSSPAQEAFTLVASGVTSPYTFTGLSAGVKAFGIKAKT